MIATEAEAVDVVIVGGGIAGLTTAFRLRERSPHLRVRVLERDARAGGTARTDGVDGFVVDRGPNGFLTNVDATLALVDALGIPEELQPSTDDASERFLFFNGRLQALPTTPFRFMASPLLPLGSRLRVAFEPFAKGPPQGTDESVWDFAARRLGPRFADAFMGPMVTGIVAGDARTMSLASLFPRMKRLEADHGSLVKAMRAVGRQRRAAREASGGPAGPGGRLTSFRSGGIEVLSRALATALGPDLVCGAGVETIERSDGRWTVRTADGRAFDAAAVVLATPAWAAARVVVGFDERLAAALDAIPYAGVRVLGLGWAKEAIDWKRTGFGFLVPRGQGLRILGCLWSSNVFPDQAPEGHVLMRVIAGGVHDPDIVESSDDDALGAVLADLQTSMGISAPPTMVHHVRWQRAIPQYLIGHADRLAAINDALSGHPGLHVTGNAYRGVALNDCVADAARVAEQVASAFSEPS